MRQVDLMMPLKGDTHKVNVKDAAPTVADKAAKATIVKATDKIVADVKATMKKSPTMAVATILTP